MDKGAFSKCHRVDRTKYFGRLSGKVLNDLDYRGGLRFESAGGRSHPQL